MPDRQIIVILHGLRNLCLSVSHFATNDFFCPEFPDLFILDILALRQIMFLKQRRNLICAPQPVIDLAVLRLANCREFNWSHVSCLNKVTGKLKQS